jgi:thioesterase DpgC
VTTFTGVLETDAQVLADAAADAAAALSGLAPKSERDAGQRASADRALESARSARRAFLALHTDAVYDVITHDRTRRIRLAELVCSAAERFPGLVPNKAQLDVEFAHIQAHREGLEIDQGLFCAAMLRSPVAGRHFVDSMLMPTERALALLDEFRATGRIDLGPVLIERRAAAAHLTFHNGHCLNAEDQGLVDAMEVAVDLALLDDQVRVGVLRGGEVDHPRYRGKRVFSAGINLKDLRNGRIRLVDFLLGRELGVVNKLMRGVLTDPSAGAWSDRLVGKPWIGAVDTFAIGGGMQLLLVLDRVIVDRDAYLSLPAAEEGIVPGLGNLRLTRATGARLARQVILGGRRIAATDSDAHLVCDQVVPAGEMAGAIERAVGDFAAPAVSANRRMLAFAEEPLDSFREYLAEFAVTQSVRAYSEDVLAKVERRWRRSMAVDRPADMEAS